MPRTSRDILPLYQLNNWGMALRRSGHADQESASARASSGAGRTVPVRLKPHLPRIFELIPSIVGEGLKRDPVFLLPAPILDNSKMVFI